MTPANRTGAVRFETSMDGSEPYALPVDKRKRTNRRPHSSRSAPQPRDSLKRGHDPHRQESTRILTESKES